MSINEQLKLSRCRPVIRDKRRISSSRRKALVLLKNFSRLLLFTASLLGQKLVLLPPRLNLRVKRIVESFQSTKRATLSFDSWSPMYEARKICNFLIARRDAQFELTNLRLNKLLYFIHGWSLTSRPEGLIRNHFLAWKLGPVVRPVFDSFKVYGDSKITEPARYLDFLSGENRPIAYDDIKNLDREIIEKIFKSYDRYTTNELVDITHEPGGPWDIVFRAWSKDNRANLRIPNDLIRKHFLKEAGGQARH